MLINLIIPPNPFLDDEKHICPLGVLYVAAVLDNVIVTDLRGQKELKERE